jgi:ADP-ribose pyrophosphatase YjhB (NUDIX family)
VHKNDTGLVYQVCCSLGKPFRFLSFDGPYKGAAADVSIFRSTILPKLRDRERVMCDRGYHQEARCWCPPTGNVNEMSVEEKKRRREVTRIRNLNERIIGRLKFWGCMRKRWHGDTV